MEKQEQSHTISTGYTRQKNIYALNTYHVVIKAMVAGKMCAIFSNTLYKHGANILNLYSPKFRIIERCINPEHYFECM